MRQAGVLKKPAAINKKSSAPGDASQQEPAITPVRYTSRNNPTGTYAQAWVDNAWQHVLTVVEKEHVQHNAIVKWVGGRLRRGELSFDEAKAQKSQLKMNSFPGF